MLRTAVTLAMLATGCGRLGFGLFEDSPDDAPRDDAPPADATPDSASFDLLINDGHLVGYWKLDDTTFADSSASGNGIGTCYVTCPTLASGLRGMAADFHNSEGLEIGTVAPLSSLANNLTLAAWVNLRTITDYAAVISNDRECSNCQILNGFSLWASITQTPPKMLLWNQSQLSFGPGAATVLPTGTWVFLASTYDGQTARLYVDGIQRNAVVRTNAIGTPHTYPLRFDRALTDTEIQTIYNALGP
jgi:hypothetical protein